MEHGVYPESLVDNLASLNIFSLFLSFYPVNVKNVFGQHVLDYALGICRGNIDYIVRLPKPLLIYLVSFLDLHSVARLSQTCKLMYEVSVIF